MVIGVKKEIFLLEDDICLREFLIDLFEDNGYHVTSSSNGQDALNKLSDGYKPDLILLDCQMPLMDGIAFRKIQMNHILWSTIPTLMLSGDPLIDFSKFGLKYFIPKPFNVLALIEQMSSLLK